MGCSKGSTTTALPVEIQRDEIGKLMMSGKVTMRHKVLLAKFCKFFIKREFSPPNMDTLYFSSQEENSLYLFNIFTQQISKANLTKYTFPYAYDLIQYRNEIYISGGTEDSFCFKVKNTMACNWQSSTSSRMLLLKCANLPEPLFYHSMCLHHDRYVFVVGGSNRNSHYIDRTYKYDIDGDMWEPYASMKVGRSKCSTISINNRLYAFGGEDIKQADVLEYIDTSKANSCFEVINLAFKFHRVKSDTFARAVLCQVDSDELMIFGGGHKGSKKSYIFDTSKKELISGLPLPSKTRFNQMKPQYRERVYYAISVIGSTGQMMISLDLQTRVFNELILKKY